MQEFKDKFFELIQEANTIAIAGHVRPDGDCIGSLSALSGYLRAMLRPEQALDVFAEFIPDDFRFLEETKNMITGLQIEEKKKQAPGYDLFISLDCGDSERLGPVEPLFLNACHTVCIDHHISNIGYAEYNFIQGDKSSTCEALYPLFEEDRIDESIATSLYLGIIHDTGVFKHSNTKRATLEIAGALIEKGVPASRIIDETFYQKTLKQNQILGQALIRMQSHLDGQVVSTVMDQKTMEQFQAVSSDLEGIVDQIRITKGARVAVFLHELTADKIVGDYLQTVTENGVTRNLPVYKVSMRVNDTVDVSKIAVSFGGGGHKKAAGCTMVGEPEQIMERVLGEIQKQF